MTYYTDSLGDENVLEYLNQVLNTKLEDEKVNSEKYLFGGCDNMKQYSVKISVKKSETTQKIVNIVKPFFEKAGLEINTNNGYIHYESNKYDSMKYVNNYELGTENEGYWDHVNVCFIITKKSDNLKGGNIDVYNTYPSFLQMIGYEKEDKNEVCLSEGDVFVMSGDTPYKIKGCSGSGHFNFIIVAFYKNKRFGYRYDNDDDE